MIIEKLKKEDLKLYKDLIDDAFEDSNELYDYSKYDEFSDKYEIIVAKDNNKIIGSITIYKIDLFTFSFQPCLELFNVCVCKEYRRQGIAKKIFEYIFNYAKENGYKQIFLTCLESATSAHKLYESVGFKRMSSVKYSVSL